ncbi:tetratricopeptide repeat protein [Lacticigenium naphthae]|uniref:tetratricopeptide repeat protein n=1 Tax=Lacticigenium naphthae TaxID=515351 RepID=UPI00040DA533|nr:tetratricopeptide repeat protein [Lacticigenium naphthae]
MSYAEMILEQLENGYYETNEELVSNALHNDSDEEIFALSEAFYQLGFLEETKKILHHLLERYPHEDEIRINLAEIAIENGEESQAIEWLASIEDTSTAYPQALLVQADLALSQGLFEVSEYKLQEAKKLMPDEPVIDFALAESFFSAGKYAQAIKLYEKLIQDQTDTFAGVNLHLRCANSYSALGDWSQAIPFYEKAVELEETADVHFQMGFTYYQLEEWLPARSHFENVVEIDPTYSSVYLYLAGTKEKLQEHKEALATVEEGMKYDQMNEALYANAAQLAEQLQEFEKATEYYTQARTLAPSNIAILLHYLEFLNATQEHEAVIKEYEELGKDEGIEPQVYWKVAYAYNELEEYEQALTYYQEAVPFLQDNIQFLSDYLAFMRDEGRKEDIKKILPVYKRMKETDLLFIEQLSSFIEER